jgi:hypothetical protein
LLEYLYCSGNLLTSLDLSNHTYLYSLFCNINYLSELNISGCNNLVYMDCQYNYLDSNSIIKGDTDPTIDCDYTLVKSQLMSDEIADSATKIVVGENTTDGVSSKEISIPFSYGDREVYHTVKGKLYTFTIPSFTTYTLTFVDMNADATVIEKNSDGTYEGDWNHYKDYEGDWEEESQAMIPRCYSHSYENISANPKTYYLLVEDSEDGEATRFNVEAEKIETVGKDEIGILGSMDYTYIEEKYPDYKGKIKYYYYGSRISAEDMISFAEMCEGTCIFVSYDDSDLEKLYSSDILADMEDIIDVDSYTDHAFAYTVEEGTYNGKLKAVSDAAYPGCFEYNIRIAEEVLGTSDPDEVQAMIDTPEKFIDVAKKMKEAGYYMTSGSDAILLSESATVDSGQKEKAKTLYDSLVKGGYDKAEVCGYEIWSSSWGADMSFNSNVFGFFSCPWMCLTIVGNTADDTATRNVCEGPILYHWGDSYYAVKSGTTDEMAKNILETICCNEDDIYTISTQSSDFPNNKYVAQKKYDNGATKSDELCLAVDPYPLWIETAEKLASTETVSGDVTGDVTGDDDVNISDLMFILNHVSGKSTLSGDAFDAGDVNGDGVIDLQDLMKILNFVSGKSKEL